MFFVRFFYFISYHGPLGAQRLSFYTTRGKALLLYMYRVHGRMCTMCSKFFFSLYCVLCTVDCVECL